jgi:hypothetical protein
MVVVTAEGSGIRAEFERMTKMECENGCKNDHFSVHSHLNSEVHFCKMRLKMKSKMS